MDIVLSGRATRCHLSNEGAVRIIEIEGGRPICVPDEAPPVSVIGVIRGVAQIYSREAVGGAVLVTVDAVGRDVAV